jgi:hypothetical protein
MSLVSWTAAAMTPLFWWGAAARHAVREPQSSQGYPSLLKAKNKNYFFLSMPTTLPGASVFKTVLKPESKSGKPMQGKKLKRACSACWFFEFVISLELGCFLYPPLILPSLPLYPLWTQTVSYYSLLQVITACYSQTTFAREIPLYFGYPSFHGKQ